MEEYLYDASNSGRLVDWGKTPIDDTLEEIFKFSILSEWKDKILSIYPNPSNDGIFKLSVKNNESHTLRVYDLSGRLIVKIKNIKDNDEFSLNHCKKGIYIANLSSSQKNSIIKLVLN